MTGAEFLTTILYPALGTLLTAAVGVAVLFMRNWINLHQQTADANQLTQVLNRGQALALAQGVTPPMVQDSVTKYLHTMAPDLAVRTGMADKIDTVDGTPVLAPTPVGTNRVLASIAENLVAGPPVVVRDAGTSTVGADDVPATRGSIPAPNRRTVP